MCGGSSRSVDDRGGTKVLKDVSTPDEKAWVSDTGELRVRRLAPHVVLYIEKGFLTADFAPHITAVMDEAVASGIKPHLFVDCEQLDGYEPAVRTDATNWLSRNKHLVTAQHMLVRSRLTQMGVTVAGMVLGGLLVGHRSRATFEAALEQALKAPAERREGAPV